MFSFNAFQCFSTFPQLFLCWSMLFYGLFMAFLCFIYAISMVFYAFRWFSSFSMLNSFAMPLQYFSMFFNSFPICFQCLFIAVRYVSMLFYDCQCFSMRFNCLLMLFNGFQCFSKLFQSHFNALKCFSWVFQFFSMLFEFV